MTKRISSALLASAAVLAVTALLAMPGSAADCLPKPGNVSHGKQLFNGELALDKSKPAICANCHGDPSQPCDPNNPPGGKFKIKAVCGCSSYPNKPGLSVNVAAGALKSTLRTFVKPLTNHMMEFIQGYVAFQDMYTNLGINTENDFNDLAAYLASADPIRYSFKGTLLGAVGQGSDPGNPTVVLCSDYNPNAVSSPPGGAQPASFSFQGPNQKGDIAYEAKNLLAGEYSVSVAPNPFAFFTSGTIPPQGPPGWGDVWLNWDLLACQGDADKLGYSLDFERSNVDPLRVIQLKTDILLASCRVCPPPVLSTLVSKINEVSRELAQGLKQPAVDSLRQFEELTRQFMRQGLIPDALGRSFIAEAQTIIELIKGRPAIPPVR